MRKLFWCCSAAGVLALGSLFAATYYAYREPASAIDCCIDTAIRASVVVQPISGLVSMMTRTNHHVINPQETASAAVPDETCIPEEPKPVELEPVAIVRVEKHGLDVEPEAAPIVIPEEEPMPREQEELIVPAAVEISELPSGPDSVCPMVMPYCTDGDGEQLVSKPVMPYTEDNDKKPATAAEDSEDSEFKAWMKLLGTDQADKEKDNLAEELPPPQEGPSAESKCQEDSRIHEHYSGCPCTTNPHTRKSCPSRAPSKKSGKEESSEEPIHHHRSLKPSGKDEDTRPHTEGVDTMEYRPSDGGLNEYGRGPL